MDLFVDYLDSQLQSPEDYDLLVSREESHRSVKSHLNKLISAASDAAKASNLLPTDDEYSIYVNNPAFSSRLSELSAKCAEAFCCVDPLFRKMEMDDYDDPCSYQAMEALSKEISLGLNVHHNDPNQRISAFRRDSGGKAKRKVPPKGIASRKSPEPPESSLQCDPEARLEQLPLEIDVDLYKRVCNHQQSRWAHLIDNFSLSQMSSHRRPKFNPIEPCVTKGVKLSEPEGPPTSDTGVQRRFVPMLYPTGDYLENYQCNKARAAVLPHPYTAEINALEWSNTEQEHSHRGRKTLGGGSLLDPKINVSGPSTPCKDCRMVQTLPELESMIAVLKGCNIVAVDVEHHSGQSYRGFVCLVQITGAGVDWVVDPFEIFDEMWRLNEVTTDPRILKVMHGAESDTLWLQRDFGVYIVNLFDTLKAADVLGLPCGHSLSCLVKYFLDVHLDKSYQLADWRVRPIPSDMLTYASADTHYLLDLYSALKNRALELDAQESAAGGIGCADNRIMRIMFRSRKVSLCQYKEHAFNEVIRSLQALRKCRQSLNRVDHLSLNIMMNLMSLRNYAARVLDESEQFVLPDYGAVAMSLAGDAKNASEVFLRSATKRMNMLQHEIPYVVKLRNTMKDALSWLDTTGEDLSEPIPLATVIDRMRQPPRSASPPEKTSDSATHAKASKPKRGDKGRSRSDSGTLLGTGPKPSGSAPKAPSTLGGTVEPTGGSGSIYAPFSSVAAQAAGSVPPSSANVSLNSRGDNTSSGGVPSDDVDTTAVSEATASAGSGDISVTAAKDKGSAKVAASAAKLKKRRAKRRLRPSQSTQLAADAAPDAATQPAAVTAKVNKGDATSKGANKVKPKKKKKKVAPKQAATGELELDKVAVTPKVNDKAAAEPKPESPAGVPGTVKQRRHRRRRRRGSSASETSVAAAAPGQDSTNAATHPPS
ncbi:exosome component 10, putative [Babesia bigemina]|uniref:Exosome component 10, putative n=1 Tax=Babesia bigemina TaxID=5866 RepID=A0A061D5L9_BABBI|nr:exosome component 10, putative [Babesia bigemina]CDR96021.1 exosome component 10, putative [Babesia bigemina]|eukprot:XP_012768207.1 exosome component 10, putative [Babesia bigemina]